MLQMNIREYSEENIVKRLILSALVLAFGLMLTASPSQAEEGSINTPEMQEAIKLFYAGEWDAAAASFEEIVNANPKDTLSLAYILDAYYHKKDVDGIVNKIEVDAAAAGEDPDSRAHLGMAYFLRGKIIPNVLDESLTEFKAAIKEDPQNSMAYTGTGLVYFQKRMMPRAKGYFVRALRLNPHDVMAMDRLGNILLVDEKKPDEAKEIFARVIEELPTYPDGHYFMGSSLFDLKQYEEALPYLKRCAELDPKGYTQGYDALTLAGDCLLNLGRKDEAIEMFEQAKAVRPDSTYPEYKIKQAKGEAK